MAVAEKFDSGELTVGDQSTCDLDYIVTGTDSLADAAAELLANVPANFGSLILRNCRVRYAGQSVWNGTVTYSLPEFKEKEVGESSFSFDTGGGTQHITQAVAHVGDWARAGQTAKNHQGTIGVTEDGNVDGVDITVPVYQWTETHVLADSQVSLAYRGTLFGLTGRMNNASFKGCAAGECLFLGASGSKRGNGDWEITFKFAASPNALEIVIGTGADQIVARHPQYPNVPVKRGWDYVWCEYARSTVNGRLVVKATDVHVEQTYKEGNLALLGIGT